MYGAYDRKYKNEHIQVAKRVTLEMSACEIKWASIASCTHRQRLSAAHRTPRRTSVTGRRPAYRAVTDIGRRQSDGHVEVVAHLEARSVQCARVVLRATTGAHTACAKDKIQYIGSNSCTVLSFKSATKTLENVLMVEYVTRTLIIDITVINFNRKSIWNYFQKQNFWIIIDFFSSLRAQV